MGVSVKTTLTRHVTSVAEKVVDSRFSHDAEDKMDMLVGQIPA